MPTPYTYKELSKRVRIMSGEYQVGTIRYVAAKIGWIYFLNDGRQGNPHSTWTKAAKECSETQ